MSLGLPPETPKTRQNEAEGKETMVGNEEEWFGTGRGQDDFTGSMVSRYQDIKV